MVVAAVLVVLDLASASACSASGSYPNFSIRSASSLAFFSASSKSIASAAPTFLAPSFGAFLAPSTLVFFAAAPDGPFRETLPALIAVGAGEEGLSFSVAERGDLEREPFPFAPAFKKGELVRLTTGGVPVRDGGLEGRLIEGLSHEEKKSSSGSPAGVFVPSEPDPAGTSVITTSSGNLRPQLTSNSY